MLYQNGRGGPIGSRQLQGVFVVNAAYRIGPLNASNSTGFGSFRLALETFPQKGCCGWEDVAWAAPALTGCAGAVCASRQHASIRFNDALRLT